MKAILILGAAMWANGPSPTLRRRTSKAVAVWKTDQTQIIIACGGLGQHPPTEAAAMTKLLLESSVPANQILSEDRSTNTFENIQFAQQMLQTHSVTQLTIVTDIYHVPRAWLVARALGLKARMAAPSLRGTHMPTQIKQVLREAAALPVYAVKLMVMRR